MTYNIWRRTDSAVLQYLVPNSKREAYIANVKDAKGNNLYVRVGIINDTPDDPPYVPPSDEKIAELERELEQLKLSMGDMHKATYDINKDGKADRAELADAIEWTQF